MATVTDQVYGSPSLDVVGETRVRVNSPKGVAEVVGQDVKITSQDGGDATGRMDIDAIDQARINSGKKVRLKAPIIDFVAQAVIVRPTHEDPDKSILVAGMMWFRSDLKAFRVYTGSAIKTLRFA